MKREIDLSQLAVQRDPPSVAAPAATAKGTRRNLLTRFVLPALLLAGFGALVVHAARETLSPPRSVTVVPVIASFSTTDAAVDTPLFRAAGWIEPRPTPTLVTALSEGVIEQLLVVEGQEVKAGQTVARLVAIDARLALEASEAEVDLRDGELLSAQAALTAAKARLELPVHLQAEVADAESALARAETEAATLPATLAAVEARNEYAKRDYEGQKRSGMAIPAISMSKAFSDLSVATSSLRELQTRQKRLPIEIAALKAKLEAQKQKLERKVDERRQLGESEAAVKAAQARLRQAKAARETARLRLERMEIKAPVGGRVLALVARPGTRLNGLAANSWQDSGTVVTLYDPASLQIRVDVRLDDVAKVRPGQKVRIETAALADTSLEGEVLTPTSQADIQKNTLSVKVMIHQPPAGLRPEMLCQVTFLAPPRANSGETKATWRLSVPRSLLDATTGRPAVWVVDQLTGTARMRVVEPGRTTGELIEVVSGLAPQEKLIVAGREGLTDGMRVRVMGEDQTLGIVAVEKRRDK